MSIFDPESFLSDACTDEPTESVGALLPEGEYEAVVRALALKETEKGNLMLTIRWFPEVPHIVAESLKLDPEKAFTISQRVFLDRDRETGKLASGTNVNLNLGRIREAVGQNTVGAWSLNSLVGCRAKVRVTQVLAYNDPSRTLNEISAVARL